MNSGSQSWRTPSLCAILVAFAISFGFVQAANAGSIWIEWDSSQDPAVIGYRVSVGTSPGVYPERFDVGPATSFVYHASDSRRYYLAVASYAAGPVVGPLSPEVSAVPDNSSPPTIPGGPPDARSFYEWLWRDVATASRVARMGASELTHMAGRASIDAESTSVPSQVCWTSPTDCLSVRTVIRRGAEITSVAAADDNRLFFIESHQRIVVVASGVLQERPLLVPESAAVHFDQVSLDPDFATTSVIYVGETEARADSSRMFRVVKYRVEQDRAAERMVIASVPLPAAGRGMFSVSSAGHIYVSVPADSSQRTPAGKILRFNVNGTTPGGQAEPAVLAAGFAMPTATVFDESTQRLWLAGVDDRHQPSLASLGGPVAPASAAVTSLTAARDSSGRSSLFFATALASLGRVNVESDGAIIESWDLRIGNSLVRAVAAASSAALFVAIGDESASAGASYSILKLTPLR